MLELIVELVIFFVIAYLSCCSLQLQNRLCVVAQSQRLLISSQSRIYLQVIHRLLIRTRILQTINGGLITDTYSRSKLTHVAFVLLPDAPSIRNHIPKIDPRAGVRGIAPDGNRVQETFVNADVLQGDVPESDSGLCSAGATPVVGVEHAAGTTSIGLLHLLGPNVDCPPHRPIHGEVMVVDVLNQPRAYIPRVGLHVDALQWSNHLDIPECDIPDAVAAAVGGHTTYAHPYTQNNSSIFDQHILSAVAADVALMAGLGHHHIIEILHCDVVDMHAGARWVDSVGVEREQWEYTIEGESLEEVDLGSCVDQNRQAVNLCIVTLVHLEMELRRVLECEVVDVGVVVADQVNQMRSLVVVLDVLLGSGDASQPPSIAAPVDLPSAAQRQMRALSAADKILVVGGVGLLGPMQDLPRGRQLALDHEAHIVDVLHSDGHGVEGALGDFDCPLACGGGVGPQHRTQDGPGVGELCADHIRPCDGPEVLDVVDAAYAYCQQEQQHQ